ncbi:MAG: hypothetical protein R3B72_28140 [Polyangiaceae bacterium]
MNRLSPESRALFDAELEREEGGVPDVVRDRMRQSLLAQVAVGAATAVVAAEAAAATATATATAATTATAASAVTAKGAAVAKGAATVVAGAAALEAGSAPVATAGVTTGLFGIGLGKLTVGVVAGAALSWAAWQLPATTPDTPPAPAAPPLEAPSEAAPMDAPRQLSDAPREASAPDAPEEPALERPEPHAAPSAPAPAAVIPPAQVEAPPIGSSDGELDEQAMLLMRARAALRAGRHAEAQRLLAIYRERHGEGALAEEQHALSAIARCGADPTSGAATAAAFAARHPQSPLRAGVERACGKTTLDENN